MKKRHFLFIPIITMGIFAISCTNTFDEQFVQEDQQMPTTKSMGDGKFQVLGYGYDITEEYLSRQAIKYAVLDIDKFVQRNPELYKVEYIGEIQDHVYGGDDYMMYSKEIIRNNKFSGSVAEKVKKSELDGGKIPYAFSASFEGQSVNKNYVTTKETYIRIDQIKQLEQYNLYSEPDSLANYLTTYFKS